ncbi:carbohydrate ABC transporter permease [Cohnella pontilimi]|uniref:Carbohydrate ABC transporter permease n=1 Tax=Cohnella pontilimi TaxID=2564100 RepID=A0A4V5LSL3_9BACL|nr:carbohydrate ABC transporter permease [Cohnella pontilimi]TJY43499.1 carbohydrate ABC transporter permease [Cohnella pontilimi]
MILSTRMKIRKYAVLYGVSVIAVIWTLFPIYWLVKSSLTPNRLMYTPKPKLLSEQWTFSHYQELFHETAFMGFMKNSMYVAVLVTVISVVISVLASYSLTRLRFVGRGFMMKSIIYTYLLPVAVLFIPMYVTISRYGLNDNKNALLFVYPTIVVPYCCYMLISYFKAIPKEMEEAALIDGCSRLQTLTKIIIPIASPGIAVVSTFAFTLSWNEYLYALVLTTSPSQQTVTIGIASFNFGDQTIWGLLTSSSVIASIPAVVLYFLAQRFLKSGLAAGGVK